MQDQKDKFTTELPMPGAKRRRGRPALPDAKTPAQRAKEYRERQKEKPKQVAGNQVEPEWAPGLRAEYDRLLRLAQDRLKKMEFLQGHAFKMEQTIAAMQKEQALLITERAKAWARVGELEEQLAELKKNRI